ncbi:MAG: saccharopine dehydrogenase NADP-binding domain-containing protein, partial [Vicinamibacteria bacterium]
MPRPTSESPPDWLIYGSNGYTGALIAEEALRRGLRPRLSGRSREAILAQASRLGLEAAPVGLQDKAALRAVVRGSCLVLHCAGPFSETSPQMLDACLAEGAHYLDITGEIDVFAACHARSAEATERGIVVVPGVGFDVVPTDGVAAMLKEALPEATSLVLAFEAGGGLSVGTAKTSVKGLGKGGRVRRGGVLVDVPAAFKTRTFVRAGKARSAMTLPWGDVFTAYVTTGIPDIEVYLAASPATIASARRLNWIRPLLRLGAVTRFLQRRVKGSLKPPSAETRAKTNAYIWGEAATADGRTARIEIETP